MSVSKALWPFTRLLVCALAALACAGPVLALDLFDCSKPRRPYCLDFPLDQYNFDTCRYEVEAFVNSTKRYIECMNEKTADAAKAAKKVIEEFNCRAADHDAVC